MRLPSGCRCLRLCHRDLCHIHGNHRGAVETLLPVRRQGRYRFRRRSFGRAKPYQLSVHPGSKFGPVSRVRQAIFLPLLVGLDAPVSSGGVFLLRRLLCRWSCIQNGI